MCLETRHVESFNLTRRIVQLDTSNCSTRHVVFGNTSRPYMKNLTFKAKKANEMAVVSILFCIFAPVFNVNNT